TEQPQRGRHRREASEQAAAGGQPTTSILSRRNPTYLAATVQSLAFLPSSDSLHLLAVDICSGSATPSCCRLAACRTTPGGWRMGRSVDELSYPPRILSFLFSSLHLLMSHELIYFYPAKKK
uniref:Uncharacterized protein n=1 Tax=Triticum urartu TaxID=4572 RepID=A0A8R7PI64_TRIUA